MIVPSIPLKSVQKDPVAYTLALVSSVSNNRWQDKRILPVASHVTVLNNYYYVRKNRRIECLILSKEL